VLVSAELRWFWKMHRGTKSNGGFAQVSPLPIEECRGSTSTSLTTARAAHLDRLVDSDADDSG